ncbi:hypothetical protein VTJ49DRAFT_2842 [Mycothermus thermophilus]|uniref:Endonuclease/exonuclease/phosphatase domain-containing protein n=1 Tax=Humicola insolens TaxID=85995 RepID=A0ABR3VA11_HUMIN
MPSPPDELNLVTLNCWGLKYVSKLRRERLTEIGRQLAIADPQPHIVALQECFSQEDYQTIRRQTRFILPYGKFYFSGVIGAGLVILSRWPIEDSALYRYPLNGRPTEFWLGDWYAGKGVAWAKIRYGPAAKHVVEVFNTHTHAKYENGKPNDTHLLTLMAQSWELAKLLRGAAERGHVVLAMGDFNMIPMSPEYQLITGLAPVRDVWRVLHPDSSLGASYHPAEEARRRPIPSAEFNIRENGATSNGPYNTWRWPKSKQKRLGPGKPHVPVSPDTPDPLGKRLDYIFANPGDIRSLGGGWVVKRVSLGMMMRHPQHGCSLSDHFSMEATLAFHPLPQPLTQPQSLLSSSPQPALPGSHPASNRGPTPTASTSVAAPVTTATTKTSHGSSPSELENARTGSALENGAFLQLQTPTPSIHQEGSEAGVVDAEDDPNNDAAISAASYRAQLAAYLDTTSPNEKATSPAPDEQPTSRSQSRLGPVSPGLGPAAYDSLLALIRAHSASEDRQRRWSAFHFFASLFITAGCLAGVWFVPGDMPYISFVLVLVSTLNLAAGVVDGLLALLFFRSELRALREFEWEVRNAKSVMFGGGGFIDDDDDGTGGVGDLHGRADWD